MSYQHRELASGRWRKLPLVEQMANIGSEVERALNWRGKNNQDYCARAVDRALELLDLSLETPWGFARLKEIARLREIVVDYFYGSNQYGSTEAAFRRYFLPFAWAARSRASMPSTPSRILN
ncbi:MAG: hypothetical protein NC910_04115 [Candidatus Omnitrophica bacterium]|nr:hypothetical protein [Candidatus Omnitrophota bacterium]